MRKNYFSGGHLRFLASILKLFVAVTKFLKCKLKTTFVPNLTLLSISELLGRKMSISNLTIKLMIRHKSQIPHVIRVGKSYPSGSSVPDFECA